MVTLTTIYTRTGDGGQTRLVGGQQVPKHSARVEAYGTVDELNAQIALVRLEVQKPSDGTALPAETQRAYDAIFADLQQKLFDLGSDIATLLPDQRPTQPLIHAEDVTAIEKLIDAENAHLGILRSFVLPGGTRLNAHLHVARTICRRAERRAIEANIHGGLSDHVIPYLNRLSDLLFVLSRRACQLTDTPEVLWQS